MDVFVLGLFLQSIQIVWRVFLNINYSFIFISIFNNLLRKYHNYNVHV